MTHRDLLTDRSRRRQGHAHEVGAAQGAARHRRPLDAGHVLALGQRGQRRQSSGQTASPSSSGPAWTTVRAADPGSGRRGTASSSRKTSSARPMPCSRRARRSPPTRATSSCSTPTRRCIEPDTLARLLQALDSGAGVAVLGFEAADPTGYGRLIIDARGRLSAQSARTRTPATAERAIRLCNSGVMAFRGDGCSIVSAASATPTPRASTI